MPPVSLTALATVTALTAAAAVVYHTTVTNGLRSELHDCRQQNIVLHQQAVEQRERNIALQEQHDTATAKAQQQLNEANAQAQDTAQALRAGLEEAKRKAQQAQHALAQHHRKNRAGARRHTTGPAGPDGLCVQDPHTHNAASAGQSPAYRALARIDPDAVVLGQSEAIAEAVRADRIRNALIACYDQYDSLAADPQPRRP